MKVNFQETLTINLISFCTNFGGVQNIDIKFEYA